MAEHEPQGEMFIDWCPVPDRVVFVPWTALSVNMPLRMEHDAIKTDHVEMRTACMVDPRNGRWIDRRYGWHEPTRTVITTGHYEIGPVATPEPRQ